MSARRYLESMWSEFGHLGNWLPSRLIRVGDIGIWDRDTGFSSDDSLRSRNLGFKTRTADHAKSTIKHRAVASMTVGIEGDASKLGQGAFNFEFGQNGGFVLHAEGCTSTTMVGGDLIKQRLKSQLRDRLWEEEYIIVSEVVMASRAKMLLSKTNNASLSLTGLSDPNDLLSADLSIVGQSGEFTEVDAENLTLMFKGFQVDKTWYGTVRARPVVFGPGDKDAAGGPPQFVEATY